MKLAEYLANRQEKMPEIDKLKIYDKIKERLERKSIFLRLSFYTKVGIYSIFLLFIFFGIFNKNKFKVNNGIINNNVIANYIGKVIVSTGSFKIIDNGKETNSIYIKKGNIIEISSNSHLTLEINNGIKLYIIGPASLEFDSYKTNKNNIYVINMLDGDYLSVKSNSKKDKIIIKSKYLNIESNDTLIDLKYVKQSDITIIENNGGNIIVKNNTNILSLNKKEKIILLSDKEINYIKNIFLDDYKKYQLTKSGQIKEVISSLQVSQLNNILDKKQVILAIGKYVLGSLNKDNNRENSGKKQLINIINNTYNILKLEVPSLIKIKIKNNNISVIDLENLISNLLTQSNKYIIPKQFTQRLKVMLAYLVILEKIKKNSNNKFISFPNLSSLINYLKLDNKYKKILLSF